MNGGSRIFDFPPGGTAGQPPLDLVADDAYPTTHPELEEVPYDTAASGTAGRIALGIAAAISVIWIALALWFAVPSLATIPSAGVTTFIAALCVPPALLGILLLLGLRTSRAEAERFGRTAAAMRAEAAHLEATVAMLSRTVDANRGKLADQAAMLLGIGDSSAARLSGLAAEMTAQVRVAGDQTTRLAGAAETARSSMEVLLATLPRAHADTMEMATALETTGISAGEHAAALDAKLIALAERGREADAVASGAAQKLAAHITRMEATSETAGARLETVTGNMAAAIDGLLDRTAGAVDEARKGIGAQGDAMLAMLGTHQAALDRASRDSADALAARISAIEALIDRIAERLGEQRDAGGLVIDELDAGLSHVSTRLDALHAQGVDRTQSLAASISALGGSADAMTEALRAGDIMATTAIATTDRLMLALDSAAREIDETLPDALARLDTRIASSRRIVGDAKPELLALVTAAESTHDAIEAIAQVIGGQRDTLDKLSGTLLETLNTGRSKADALGGMVDETIERTHRFAEEAAPRLIEALLRVRDTASAAADRARDTLANVIPEAAEALEAASAAAMRRATEITVTRQIAALTDAGAAAATAAELAAARLEQHLDAITTSTALVENRLEDARIERESADRDTFARRVSLLIESLNSASIDITRSFSTEVSDSAWAAYLKGDRGVFTRRAVRLVDAGDAREIARLYDDDAGFREQVNRYIHDFEAMLRTILAQRDGSPLGVTLLSSDMGKLYVVLAQAIERLRT